MEPVTPPPCPTGDLFVVGQSAHLLGDGFGPDESLTVEFLFPAGASVETGPVVAGPDGSLDAEVVVPASATGTLPAIINVGGIGANGAARLLVSDFVVITDDPSADADGDGVPDACDKCPQVYDPDQADDDVDGRGNACDVCPLDPENDVDDDSLCVPEDAKPFDPDNDGDGILGRMDNCVLKANPTQLDTNQDGFGNACDADYTNDGFVGGPDFGILSQAYGAMPGDPGYDPDVDSAADGIGGPEYGLLSSQFGGAPGPSGLDCAGTIPCP